MEPFSKVTAVAAPIDMANVDTDKIIPARFLRKLRSVGYGQFLFHDIRLDESGRERPEFVLNQPAYRDAQILVAGANFGCGSSREGAVYALQGRGVRAVVAPSFGDIHYGNALQNGFLPEELPEADCATLRAQLKAQHRAKLTVDLETQQVTGPDGTVYAFVIDAESRERLLKGLDEIDLVLQHLAAIEAYEQRDHAARPWLA
jgi:3-isopropylmalate/(R)-2-methylmalate dehydratase small subunit